MEISNRTEKRIIAAISIGFVLWSGYFIYKTSSVAIDGNRYFSLFDDAMISMRYAYNFSHGLGLVWNAGEYVQGYSNLLMTLLMSVATLIFDKSTAVLVVQIMGVGFMLGIGWVSLRIAEHMIRNEQYPYPALIRILTYVCVLAYYPLAYWSLMGMETGLLTLLVLLAVLSALNYTETKQKGYISLGVLWLGLAFMTRNESLIIAALIGLYLAWEILKPKVDRKNIVILLVAVGLYLSVVIGQLVFQYLYYGEWLSNTYILKLTGMPLGFRIRNGIGFTLPFLIETSMILALASLNLVLGFDKRRLLLLTIAYSAIFYLIYIGGDAWNYWRITAPAMPLLMILFIDAGVKIIRILYNLPAFIASRLDRPIVTIRFLPQVMIICLVLLGLLTVNWRFLPEMSLVISNPYQTKNNSGNINLSILINRWTTENATVGVIWAGTIPYYTNRKAIDFLGKNDRYIANLPPDLNGATAIYGLISRPGHNKYDFNYSIKTLLPTYASDFGWGGKHVSKWGRKNYVSVNYQGFHLAFLKNSQDVLWDKIKSP
jgi:hypothetical protein